MADPFKIYGPTVLSFSGGRTSAYLLWRVLQSNTKEDIARWLIVIFANTGKEEEATLRFVLNCSRMWGVSIVWVEYRAPASYEVVTFDSASRHGEPFEALMRHRMLLPNPPKRFCSQELKIRTMARYLKDAGVVETVGEGEFFAMVGIRADEARRAAKIDRERVPLVTAGIGSADVGAFWKTQPFDLELPNMNGKTMHGNCDLCFLKPADQIQSLIAEKPERATWWIRMERDIPALGRTTGAGSVFRMDRPSYAEIARFSSDQRTMFDPNEEAIACFCGD